MTPATYVDKVPTYTACQWDGSEESAQWILGVYGAQASRTDDRIVIEGAVRPETLETGSWVIVGDNVVVPLNLSDEDFRHNYQAR